MVNEQIDNKSFTLLLLGGLAAFLLIGCGIGGCVFVQKYNADKEVKQRELEMEERQIREDEKTERTEERWGSLPFLRRDHEDND